MKRFFTLAILLLTACVPTSSAPGVDPAYQLQMAEVQAEYYASQLTATAVAPILEVTRAAAALEMTVQVQNLNGTQTAIPLTSTAQSWTPTVTTTPTVNVTGTIAVEQMNAEVRKLQLETERRQNTNSALAVAPYLVGVLVLALALFVGYVGAQRLAMMPTPIHEGTGKPQPVMNVLNWVVLDPDRMANGAGQVSQRYLEVLPPITADRQHLVTSQAQSVDLQTRIKRLPRELVQAQGQRLLEAPSQLGAGNEAHALFPLPSWELVNGWNFDKSNVPLGNSESGLEYWQPRTYPHLAIFGRTRTGKSRRSLRPLVALLLASGQRVVLTGKEIDFLPFLDHPNVVFIPVYDLTRKEEALKYYNVLAATVEEKERRIRYMASRGISLWQEENTYMVFDELGNAINDMPDNVGEDTLRKAASVVNEGGKAGLNMIFSAQRPKGFIDLTTQCGRVVFQVETDQEKGFALGYSGASKLPSVPTGYFYRKFSSVKVTGAFEPTDDEIRALLSRRAVASLPKEDWVLDNVPALPTQPGAVSLPEPEPRSDIEKLAEAIRDQWNPEMSKRAIGALLGKQYGGAWASKIDQMVEYLKSNPSLEGNAA